jgi:[ribosomal protein S5]-alanine N-acetyltransferase
MKFFAETNRFYLREITEQDLAGMFALDADPEVHRYLGNKPVTSMQETEVIIQNVRKQYQDNGIGRWAIIDKNTGVFIGWSGLKLEKNLRKGVEYYDLGYRLRREYWGQGIASESARLALDYGFNTLNLSEIFAAAQVANIASNKILQKVGLTFIETFDYEGVATNWYGVQRT